MSVKSVKVGDLAMLESGEMLRVEVSGLCVLLANIDGRIFAIDDTCTHEDASLSNGSLRGEFVKCPLHGSQFNVCTGQAVDEPAERDLKSYPVRVEGTSILIEL